MTEEPTDILEQVKKAEQVTKKRALLKRISTLKEKCKAVLLAKKECELILADSGVSEEDSKRLIDYLNSLAEVQLTEDEIKDLSDNVKLAGKVLQKKVQEEIGKLTSAYTFGTAIGTNAISLGDLGYGQGTTYTTSATNGLANVLDTMKIS